MKKLVGNIYKTVIAAVLIGLSVFILSSVQVHAAELPSGSFTGQILVNGYALSKDSNNVVILEKNAYSTDQYWDFTPLGNNYYKILNHASRQALDVSGAKDRNGTNIQVYSANGTAAQCWRLVLQKDGSYCLSPKSSRTNRVIDVAGGSFKNKTNVQLYQSNGTQAQKFTLSIDNNAVQSSNLGNFYARIISNDRVLSLNGSNIVTDIRKVNKAQVWKFEYQSESGTYTIRNIQNGKVLDVSNASDRNYTNVQTYNSNNTKAQKWYILENKGAYYLRPACAGHRVIDISGNSYHPGTNVQLYEMNNTIAQKFTFEKCGNAADMPNVGNVFNNKVVKIKNQKSGLSLTQNDESANVFQMNDNNTMQQLWRLKYNDSGYYTLINLASGKALDVSFGSNRNGANIQTYKSNSTAAQHWIIQKYHSQYILRSGVSANRVLDISNGSKNADANVQLYESNGTQAQVFSISEKTSETNAIKPEYLGNKFTAHIKNVNSQLVATRSGNNVNQQKVTSSKTQGWTFKHNSDNSYTIYSVVDNKVIDVSGGTDANGANIQAYASNGTKAQKWFIVKSGAAYVLRPELSSSRVMDVSSGSKNENANIQLYTANGTAAQQFSIEKISANSFAKVDANINGIDVSEHQKDINWSQTKNAGVRFAMVRVGWGHAGNGAVDKKFYQNYTNARAAGIPIGVYVYSYADNANEAVQEANYALSILNGRALDLPVCIDLEDEKTTGKHSKAEITAMAKAFCERVKQAGYTPMIYANRNWLQTKIDYNQIKQYRIWYAQYPYANRTTQTMWTTWNAAIKPAYSNHVDIWQFTSQGKVNGINGNVDLNRSIAAF